MNKTKVFITVDTEHSIGGAFRYPNLNPVGNEKRIFGKFGNHFYGIPLIMDIADKYGLPVVFFLEVLNHHYFGKNESRQVCEYILDRGHDVQLHLHPVYLNFKEDHPECLKFKDNMSFYSLNEQIELLGEGKHLLEEYGVKNVTAFRAGNYGANIDTLKALSENGFLFDSSYNLAFPNKSRLISNDVFNDITKIEGIFELPITCFNEKLPLLVNKVVPMDINAASFSEMKEMLIYASKNNFKCVTIIFHSFSFYIGKDLQYTDAHIIDKTITKFKKLCHFLSENKDSFLVQNFCTLRADQSIANKNILPKIGHIPLIENHLEKIISRLRYGQ